MACWMFIPAYGIALHICHDRTYVSIRSCNIVGLAVSSAFGLGFFFAPRHFLSQWFEAVDDGEQAAAERGGDASGAANGDGDVEMAPVANVSAVPSSSPVQGGRRKAYSAGGGGNANGNANGGGETFLGFTLLRLNGMDYFFARAIGITIIGFNLGMGLAAATGEAIDGLPDVLDHPLYSVQLLFISTLPVEIFYSAEPLFSIMD